MSKPSFCFPVPDYKANKIESIFGYAGKSHLLGVLIESGAFIPDTAKYVLQYKNNKNELNWFATIDFLESGKDGVFVRLNHPLNTDHSKLPEFDDVFEMMDGDEFIRRAKEGESK